MKLAAVLALAVDAGLSADKVPALEASIIAADKKAKDDMPGNVASSKQIEDKRAADRKARDEKKAADRKAKDAAFEEKKAADRKARDEKCAADRKARDAKFGEDRNDDPEGTNDAAMEACDAEMKAEAEDESKEEEAAEDSDVESGDPSTPGGNRAGGKTAIDSAQVDARIAAAIAERDALHEARVEVEPIVGKVAHDSAAAVYGAALTKLGVDHKGVSDTAALRAMVKLAKDKAAPLAADGAPADAGALSKIPGYSRLK